MGRRSISPAYFADTEGSDTEPCDMERSHRKSKSKYNVENTKRVVVRTPSEERLYASGHTFDQTRRPVNPNAIKRHSSQSKDKNKPVRSSKCDKAIPVAAPSQTVPLGTQSYNNPVSSSAPAGVNHIFVHHHTTAPSSFPTNTPQDLAAYFPGQSILSDCKMAEQLGPYQNAGQPMNGYNFQPQAANTSLGPMYHQYIPRYDGQPGAYMIVSGIVPQGVAGPLQAGITTNPMMPIPIINQQPYPSQPMAIGGGGGNLSAGQPMMMAMAGGSGGGVPPGQPVLVNGGPAPMMPGTFPPMSGMAAPFHYDPATGMGQTAGEVAAACKANRELNEPQDFQPADTSPSRMYYVRQLDGQYIQMPRATIDSFGKDGARWYCTDEGVFYAVRLDG